MPIIRRRAIQMGIAALCPSYRVRAATSVQIRTPGATRGGPQAFLTGYHAHPDAGSETCFASGDDGMTLDVFALQRKTLKYWASFLSPTYGVADFSGRSEYLPNLTGVRRSQGPRR